VRLLKIPGAINASGFPVSYLLLNLQRVLLTDQKIY